MPNRKRRGRGEGAIFERADGKWSAEVSLGFDGDGKRKRKTVYGRSKGEVAEKLRKLQTAASTGTIPASNAMTVGLLLERWINSTRPDAAVRTTEERERLIRNHIRPKLGRVKLTELNALHIESFYADLRTAEAGGWTIRSAADLVSIALNYAVRLKLIPFNPSKGVPKPKGPKREMVFLDQYQAKAVLVAADARPIGLLVKLAITSGCRQGELLALGWDDVDFKKGALSIRRSLCRTKDGFVLKEPKTAASRRVVTLPAFVVADLAQQKAKVTAADRLSLPVFCTSSGRHLDKHNVIRAFRGVVALANKAIRSAPDSHPQIPSEIRFHDLRHTHASLLLSSGESLRAVASRLGHAKPTMTLSVYGHTMPSDDPKLAQGIGRLLG